MIGFSSEEEKKHVFERLQALESRSSFLAGVFAFACVIGMYAGWELRQIRVNQVSAAVLTTEMNSVKSGMGKVETSMGGIEDAQRTMTATFIERQWTLDALGRDVEVLQDQVEKIHDHLDDE